jgi:hypothetical protein
VDRDSRYVNKYDWLWTWLVPCAAVFVCLLILWLYCRERALKKRIKASLVLQGRGPGGYDGSDVNDLEASNDPEVGNSSGTRAGTSTKTGARTTGSSGPITGAGATSTGSGSHPRTRTGSKSRRSGGGKYRYGGVDEMI